MFSYGPVIHYFQNKWIFVDGLPRQLSDVHSIIERNTVMLNSYLIKNGTLVSILDGSEEKKDILVENGVITKIAENIQTPVAEVFDAAGKYVSVGWLESHAHFAAEEGVAMISDVDDLLRQGVTYALDLGSTGPVNYAASRVRLMHKSDLRYRAYLYIGNTGAGTARGRMDFEGPQDIEPERVKACAEKYREELMGLKARIDDKFCFDPEYVMGQMRKLGDELGMTIAVHAPRSRIGIDKLLTYLKKGDVLCHTLAGNSEVMDILDAQGNIKQSVLEAKERGVVFELSHGTNAYSYDTAEAAWKAGFFVDTIGSDLHMGNINGPVFSPSVILTKVRGLTGQPWWWILNKMIAGPVTMQNIPDKAVEIREGMNADLTVYTIEEGEFTYLDSKKASRTFREKITPVYTCTGSKVYTCR